MTSYERVKKIINSVNYGFRLLKGINDFSKEHHLENVRKITDKLLNNNYVNKTKNAFEIADRITKAIDQQRNSGLFNPVHSDINKIGINHARSAHRRATQSLNEREMAENIVNNIN